MRLLRFSFSLSLSLSEEQTKAKSKVCENSLAFKKLSFSQSSCFPLSVLFHFSLFTHKNLKKSRFLVYPNRCNEKEVFISHRVTLFLLRRVLACSRARVDRSENTRTHSYTHTQRERESIIISWRERCTCSPR